MHYTGRGANHSQRVSTLVFFVSFGNRVVSSFSTLVGPFLPKMAKKPREWGKDGRAKRNEERDEENKKKVDREDGTFPN